MKMTRARLDRLAAMRAPLRGGVLIYGPHETPEQAVERAAAAGRQGAFVCVPQAMGVDEWQRGAAGLAAYQESCRRAWEEAHARRLQQSQG